MSNEAKTVDLASEIQNSEASAPTQQAEATFEDQLSNWANSISNIVAELNAGFTVMNGRLDTLERFVAYLIQKDPDIMKTAQSTADAAAAPEATHEAAPLG